MTAAPSAANRFLRHSTVVSGVVAVILGAVAVGLIAETTLQRQFLMGALIGVSTFGLGGRLWHRWRGAVGLGLVVCGCLVVTAAAGNAVTQPPRIIHRLELLPGILGLWTLAAALVPIGFRWSRLLIAVGSGLLFVAVLTSGVVRGASTTALVVAAAATILAWDAAENAVSLGVQVGAHPETVTVRGELAHVMLSGGLAAGAVVAVLGVTHLGVDSLPFEALVALLVAGVVLLLASHR
ncbi:DUF7519 family protein [Halobaculum gomorrense]|uniref:Uncharacterized protein n=1 Tax=Halobaculum gomorrense TaxID=43928 RepID=A0A1M5JB29_9EURY|nr:hypothetical protein [Halobaculum gomorrense]SHG37784.1 hypothetical protein SAMN05443636_0028 [Halobaculum gomorrense]